MTIFCYQHHINDWRRDTSHLSLEERGVYRELLDAYYATDGRLPSDCKQLARIIGVQTQSERRALASVVSQFFIETNGILSQKRAQLELERMKEKGEKASASARAKYNKNNNMVSANAVQTQQRAQSEGICERSANQEPITNNQEKKEAAASISEIAPKAEEAAPPKVDKITEKAVEIITALDEALVQFFGASGARLGPAAMDPVTAQRWVKAGGEVDACRNVIRSVVERQRAKGRPAPQSLSYFERPIIEALATKSETMPDLSPAEAVPLKTAPEIVALLRMHPKFTDDCIRRWFDPCTFDMRGGRIIAPSTFHAEWIDREFSALIRTCIGADLKIMVKKERVNAQ